MGAFPASSIRLSREGFRQHGRAGSRRRASGSGTAMPDKRVAALRARSRASAASPFYHGIPGGIGGALRMNAGANGGETRERRGRGHARSTGQGTRADAEQRRDGLSPTGTPAPADDLIFVSSRLSRASRRTSDEDHPRGDGRRRGSPRDGRSRSSEKTGGSTFKNPARHLRPGRKSMQAGCRGLIVSAARRCRRCTATS
jgi:UDP-N-acetylmuramate dehydrogenase